MRVIELLGPMETILISCSTDKAQGMSVSLRLMSAIRKSNMIVFRWLFHLIYHVAKRCAFAPFWLWSGTGEEALREGRDDRRRRRR